MVRRSTLTNESVQGMMKKIPRHKSKICIKVIWSVSNIIDSLFELNWLLVQDLVSWLSYVTFIVIRTSSVNVLSCCKQLVPVHLRNVYGKYWFAFDNRWCYLSICLALTYRIKLLPGPLAFRAVIRPSLNMTARSYSFTIYKTVIKHIKGVIKHLNSNCKCKTFRHWCNFLLKCEALY